VNVLPVIPAINHMKISLDSYDTTHQTTKIGTIFYWVKQLILTYQ